MTSLAPEIAALTLAGEPRAEQLDEWLTPRERARYLSLRTAVRRREWVAGRVAAKQALSRRCAIGGPHPFQRIEVVAAATGRPGYLLDGRPGEFGLSIGHAAGQALVAVSRERGQPLGVDLEPVEDRGRGFEALLLSPEETRALGGVRGRERERAVTLAWVLKEALLKAMGVGLALPLPDLTVAGGLRPGGIHAFRLRGAPVTEVARAHSFELGSAVAACVVLEAGAA